MASLREIRRKIKAVGAQQRIFKAMKMIAAARMRRSQASILSARPFAAKMEELVRHLAELEIASDISAGREVQVHSFFDVRKTGRVALLLVTADKGLCGSFNAGLLRATFDWLGANKDKKKLIAVVGRKGRDFVRRLKGQDLEIITELAGIFPKVNFTHAELIGKAVIDAYNDKELESVTALYNEFKSVAVQKVITSPILPIPAFEGGTHKAGEQEYGFEPDRQELLSALLPRYIKARIYRILLESQAAELAARMNAMDSASKNAKELRDAMNLNLNRTRQAMITREIAELVGGAEALAS